MEKYDYYAAMKSDIEDYIADNVDLSDYRDKDELQEALNDALWADDNVTGNGSGSYTFDSRVAEENLCHNLDLLKETLDEFWDDITASDLLGRGAEAMDAMIRCYLLSQVLAEVVDALELPAEEDDAE